MQSPHLFYELKPLGRLRLNKCGKKNARRHSHWQSDQRRIESAGTQRSVAGTEIVYGCVQRFEIVATPLYRYVVAVAHFRDFASRFFCLLFGGVSQKVRIGVGVISCLSRLQGKNVPTIGQCRHGFSPSLKILVCNFVKITHKNYKMK